MVKQKYDPNKRYCMCNNKDCCVKGDAYVFGCDRTDPNIPGEVFCVHEMGEEENRFCGDCKYKNAGDVN